MSVFDVPLFTFRIVPDGMVVLFQLTVPFPMVVTVRSTGLMTDPLQLMFCVATPVDINDMDSL